MPLWQIVGDIMPGCFGPDKDVALRLDAWIVIKRPKWKAQPFRVRVELGHDVGAANRAKNAMLARRGLVSGWQVLTRKPFEIRSFDGCSCSKGRSVGLSAHAAMAIENADKRPSDLIVNLAAQATSGKFVWHGSVSL